MGFVQNTLIFLRKLIRRIRSIIRVQYYRLILKDIGKGCSICKGVIVFEPENISLGDNVHLNENVILQSCDNAEIKLGNRVILSYGTIILTGSADFKDRSNFGKHVSLSVIIEDRAVINARCVVFPGVKIGAGAVVAAGSIVTQDVRPNTMVFGVPARVIKYFEPEDNKIEEVL